MRLYNYYSRALYPRTAVTTGTGPPGRWARRPSPFPQSDITRSRKLGDPSARRRTRGRRNARFFDRGHIVVEQKKKKKTPFETTKTEVLYFDGAEKKKNGLKRVRVHCRRSKAAAAAAVVCGRGEQQVVVGAGGVEVNAAAAAAAAAVTVGRDERTSRQHRGDWRTAAVAKRVDGPCGEGGGGPTGLKRARASGRLSRGRTKDVAAVTTV